MRMVNDFPRSRRAVLAAGGAALVGCASLGLISLGAVSAEPDPAAALAVSAPGLPVEINPPGVLVDVKFETADLKQQQAKFVTTLAGKLGVSADKLQQALTETQQEVGPVPLMFGPPGAGGTQTFAISISSDVATAAKVLGISADQLRKELNGKSLTDVARAHDVDPEKVASALKAARETDLDQAAQANKIPADVVSRMRANLDKEIALQMTMVRGASGMWSTNATWSGTGPGPGPDVRSVRIILKDPGQ